MKYLVISSSLRPGGNSQAMADSLCYRLRGAGEEAELLMLNDYEMPFCDGKAYLDHPTTQLFREKVGSANGIVLATPIYNYDTNAVAKNFIEITGQAWQNKVVGFLCTAGGEKSYMSIMALANSLMLDFRCVIIPRFVYASDDTVADEAVVERIHELADELVRFTTNLNSS
ncbi:MAG: NAD(P)H-dependent oxidoreductase [Candidatus Neomarinimicrobiota bacterium]|nr:NAD(P)H-dependent oxidoreductase [Candidatus Neomarinimicrobiota bacterium]